MTIKQNLKRFVLTSILFEITTIIVTAGVFYSIYITNKLSNDAIINNLESTYERLQAEEKGALQFLNTIEQSSDEKKRNVVRRVGLEKKIIKMLSKISEIQPYFKFQFKKIDLDNRYVNIAHIHIKVKLKDAKLGDQFYVIYSKILEKAFSKIQGKKFRSIERIGLKEYKIIYKKDYI